MSTSAHEQVLISIREGVGTITMNRPDKRNALGRNMVTSLVQAFTDLEADTGVRVVILKAAGTVFCAGADLADLKRIASQSVSDNIADSALLGDLFEQIINLRKPVIASVQGPALAGGCGLATACDIVIADGKHARFGYPEVAIGFLPAMVMVFLIRKVGDTMARRLILTGDTLSANEALDAGVVSYVSEEGCLEADTQKLALRMTSLSGTSLALAKHMLPALQDMSLHDGLKYAQAMNALARQTADFKKGIDKFLTKDNG